MAATKRGTGAGPSRIVNDGMLNCCPTIDFIAHYFCKRDFINIIVH